MREQQFNKLMDIVSGINSSYAAQFIGDMADSGYGIDVALHVDETFNEDGCGYQVGFYVQDGFWTCYVWGTLAERTSDIPRVALRLVPESYDVQHIVDVIAGHIKNLAEKPITL